MSFWWILIASLMLGLASVPALMLLRDRSCCGNWLAPGTLVGGVGLGALAGWASQWLDVHSVAWIAIRLVIGAWLVAYGFSASKMRDSAQELGVEEAGPNRGWTAALFAVAVAPAAVMLAFAVESGGAAHGGATALAFAIGAATLGAFHLFRCRPARTVVAASGLAFVVGFGVMLQSLHTFRAYLAASPVYESDSAVEMPDDLVPEDEEALGRYPIPTQAQLAKALPGAERFVLRFDPAPHYEGRAEPDTPLERIVGYAFVCQHFVAEEQLDATRGYGSFLPVLLGVSVDAKTTGVVVLENRETAVYLKYATAPERLERYVGRPLSAPFEPGDDVDAVSGATFTTNALAAAVRYGAQGFEEAVLRESDAPLAPEREATARAFPGWRDFVYLSVLAVGAVLILTVRSTIVETVILAVAVVLLGVVFGRFFSLDDALRLALGDLPPFAAATGWWLTVGGVLALTLLLGRVFCRFFCPFGALAELLWRGARVRLRMPRRWDRLGRRAPAILLWAAGLWYAMTGVLPASRIEPFAAPFNAATSLEAARSLMSDDFLLLGVVVVALVGSALNRRFWCLYLCPVGAALRVLSRLRLSNAGVPARCGACPSDPGEEILCPGCAKTRSRPMRRHVTGQGF